MWESFDTSMRGDFPDSRDSNANESSPAGLSEMDRGLAGKADLLPAINVVVRRVLRRQRAQSTMERWILAQARQIAVQHTQRVCLEQCDLIGELSERLCSYLIRAEETADAEQCWRARDTVRPLQTLMFSQA
ncbi:MAG TPA: hypothetical protein EYP14_14390 [Planctomycetaceae bacterium]|nr:hypothetical protein [Planctomycetaceae bacterium]